MEMVQDRSKIDRRKSLEYSRHLGLHTWSDDDRVTTMVEHVYRVAFGSRKSSVSIYLLRIVLLELYLAWLNDPDLKLSVSRNNNDYAQWRYNGLCVTKTIIPVINRLRDAGLIHFANGHYDRMGIKKSKNARTSYLSRIWANDELASVFRHYDIDPTTVTRHHREEPIRLNRPDPQRPKGTLLSDYEETPDTKRMRFILDAYNGLLSRTDITIPDITDGVVELPDDEFGNPRRLFLSPHDRHVHRVFNRGSFEKGGRFYGGWWQDCPSEIRSRILLDGRPTVELDYPCHLPTILYAMKGIAYRKEIDGDAYEIDLPDELLTCIVKETGGKIALREVYKKLLLIAINTSPESVPKAFRGDWSKGAPEKHLTDKTLYRLLSLLRSRHTPIANYFHTGAGLDVQNIDSRMTERIVEHFTRKGIPVLTIHDSYVIPAQYEAELREQMDKARSHVISSAAW